MAVQCCVCNRTKQENGWLIVPTTEGVLISHGYCPHCFKKSMRELEHTSNVKMRANSAV